MVASQYSYPATVTSGVPQGSILGPLLYNLYVNDLPNVVQTEILMFADAIKLFNVISSTEDTVLLQRDIASVAEWARVRFQPQKCSVMRYSLNKGLVSADYQILGVGLNSVTTVKDLGVLFYYLFIYLPTCSKLTVRTHNHYKMITV